MGDCDFVASVERDWVVGIGECGFAGRRAKSSLTTERETAAAPGT